MKCSFCSEEANHDATVVFEDEERIIHVCANHLPIIRMLSVAVNNGHDMGMVENFIASMNGMLVENKLDIQECEQAGEDYLFDNNNLRALEKLLEIMVTNEEVAVKVFEAWLGIKKDFS